MKLQTPLIATMALLRPSQACFDHLAPRALAGTPSDCPGPVVPPEGSTAIVNAQVFTGEGFEGPQTVVLSDGQITSIGGDAPEGATVIDGSGKFLIPGLIDGHVHPTDCTALGQLAGWGVTTAINMNCQDYDACAALRAQSGVADFVTAGFFAVGLGSSLALLQGVPLSRTIRPSTNLAARVDEDFSNGADFFKIVAELLGPSQRQQNEIVQLVRGYGKFTATHATELRYYNQAIESGSESIQHSPSDGLLSSQQINKILSQNQFITPTMEFYRTLFGNESLLDLVGLEGQYSTVQRNVALLREAGVPIVAGTDAVGSFLGIIDFSFGETLHCELQNLARAGFGNAEAIRAATSVAAERYRLDDRGSIAEGLRADLVLLNSDPLANIGNTLDVESVWVAGIAVENVLAEQDGACS